MYEFYIRCLIFIRKAFYLYRTSTSRISAIKSFSEMLAFVFAFSFFFVYFHSHYRASKVFWTSKVFFQRCSLSFSHSFLYILIRIIEHRKPPRKPCHPRGLDLPLIQDGRAYPTTTLLFWNRWAQSSIRTYVSCWFCWSNNRLNFCDLRFLKVINKWNWNDDHESRENHDENRNDDNEINQFDVLEFWILE